MKVLDKYECTLFSGGFVKESPGISCGYCNPVKRYETPLGSFIGGVLGAGLGMYFANGIVGLGFNGITGAYAGATAVDFVYNEIKHFRLMVIAG
ncbi:MAG: hypothetical protein ACHQJ6_02660 [Candidatus Berkiellales bacterium]